MILILSSHHKAYSLTMFLENITEEQIEQFREAFALFDKDGDGCINNKQLKIVLRSLGHNPSKQDLEIFTTLVDEDRSGTIDFREFLILISQRLNEKTLFDQIIQSFKIIDKDQDGFLERFQLIRVLENQGIKDMDEVENILDQLDQGQGKISISQYVNHMIRTQFQRQS